MPRKGIKKGPSPTSVVRNLSRRGGGRPPKMKSSGGRKRGY